MIVVKLVLVSCFLTMGLIVNAQKPLQNDNDGEIMLRDTGSCNIKWIFNTKETNSRSLRWTLFPAYNDNDGFMCGFLITNGITKVHPKFSFSFSPSYTFTNSKLLGQSWLNFDHVTKQDNIAMISYRVGIKSFDFNINKKFNYSQRYLRFDPSVTFHFRHLSPDVKQSQLALKSFFINEEEAVFVNGDFDKLSNKSTLIHRIVYQRLFEDDIQRSDIDLSLEYQAYNSDHYLKVMAISDQRYLYSSKKNLYFRFFATGFIVNTQRMSGSFQNIFTRGSIALIQQGFNDYSYDEYFFSRQNQNGFQDDQVSLTSGGGFKTPVGSAYSIGMSNNFAAAVNFSADIPFRIPTWLPLRIYFDAGTYSTYSGTKFISNMIYNGGFSFNFNDVAALHIPLFYSNDLGNIYKETHNDFFSRMSFTLNLHRLKFKNLKPPFKNLFI